MSCYLCEGKAMGANYSRVYAIEGAKGPAHGLCALAEIKRLEAENARLLAALAHERNRPASELLAAALDALKQEQFNAGAKYGRETNAKEA